MDLRGVENYEWGNDPRCYKIQGGASTLFPHLTRAAQLHLQLAFVSECLGRAWSLFVVAVPRQWHSLPLTGGERVLDGGRGAVGGG